MAAQGIIYGLFSALFGSLSFVFARVYMTRPKSSPFALFALAHVWMGAASAIMVPFLWSEHEPGFRAWAGPLVWTVGFYVAGQFLFFFSVKRAEASRVSPLLGLKVLFLALVTVLVLRQPLAGVQWLAVGLCLAAAVGLNYTGGMLPRAAAGAMTVAALVYALSDLGVAALARVFSPDGSVRGVLLASFVSYVLCLLIAVAMLPAIKPEQRRREDLIAALPVGASWLVAGVLLFACFREIGPLFGNIVQSLRGPFSVVMGLLVASLGQIHLEQKLTASVFLRRLASAVLMCIAIALFMIGGA
jgi:uncharacterized membrane protein